MGPIRIAQARTRPRSSPVKVSETIDNDMSDISNDISEDEPPLKRLRTSRKSYVRKRWVPGGRGGGGRRLEHEAAEIKANTNMIVDRYSAPRGRRRENGRRTNLNSRTSTRTRTRGTTRPRYSTAAAATAAAAHNDGYKPREERGWEEFHPDLDLESAFAVIPSAEVDGVVPPKQEASEATPPDVAIQTPPKRRPGRPQRTRDSMLQALLIPEQPKLIPRPGPNPRERLTLPKPSYRTLDPFLLYEQKDKAAINFVNQAMANVGYQESEEYTRLERTYIRQMEGAAEEDLDLSPDLQIPGNNSAIGSTGVGRVEYDMDEQDVKWLEAFNKTRTDDGQATIKPAIFEITMTKIEKEWHALEKRIPKPNPKAPQTLRPRSSSAAAVNGEPQQGEEPDSKCAICDDGDCENANAIVFCDGCDLAVHQECYGVPYIPEGQWLCRKCQLVGNARPSCIFCPNEGGAFKQTNNSKWAHLLCATWIPEVTIGNPSLMEPITDVEKVPNSRWKLHCYICKQDMGASIQCSDGRCYEAFHLTCARQAGLYLKMKVGGGQNTLMDSSQLRAYCHRHTPTEWRTEHNTDKSFELAIKHFKAHFHGQIWADSRASALAISEPIDTPTSTHGQLKMTLTNKKGQKPKTIWRLPSGAPVVPEVILKSIEESLLRFAVSKKKEYVSEVCKYWTLKREARRGAALLKRLQLQMDTFSSFEVTRRDYKAQGAAGRARLDRRLAFAENLAKDLERIRAICELIKSREEEKLKEALLLREMVNMVYFPMVPLLQPIIERAMKLDSKGIYRHDLTRMTQSLSERGYITVASFSSDFAKIFQEDLGFDAMNKDNMAALYSRPALTTDTEHRDRRTLARRIVKVVQPLLEAALRKEAELNGRPFEQQMREMDEMLFSRRYSNADVLMSGCDTSTQPNGNVIEAEPEMKNENIDMDILPIDGVVQPDKANSSISQPRKAASFTRDEESHGNEPSLLTSANTPPASMNGHVKYDPAGPEAENVLPAANPAEPPTPPMSTREQVPAQPIGVEGGIPWYIQPFDPDGITIWEERWTGPEVLRDMSEELSEMDEDELQDLGIDEDNNENDNTDDIDMIFNSTDGRKPHGVYVSRSGRGALTSNVRPNRNSATVTATTVNTTIGAGSSFSASASSSTTTKRGGKRKRGNGWAERSFRLRR